MTTSSRALQARNSSDIIIESLMPISESLAGFSPEAKTFEATLHFRFSATLPVNNDFPQGSKSISVAN